MEGLKLLKPRDNSLCWGLSSGDVLLFGGHDNGTDDTERVLKDASASEFAFELKKNHEIIE